MSAIYTSGKVLGNKKIAEGIYRLTVSFPGEAAPVQFFTLRCGESYPLLSRPISVCDKNPGSVTFLYEVKGEGTGYLKGLKNGDLIDMLGPLGKGFPEPLPGKKAAIVSGGIGIAPLLYLAKSMKGEKPDLYCGFRDKSYLTGAVRPFVKSVRISTDSGKEGHKGLSPTFWTFPVTTCCTAAGRKS